MTWLEPFLEALTNHTIDSNNFDMVPFYDAMNGNYEYSTRRGPTWINSSTKNASKHGGPDGNTWQRFECFDILNMNFDRAKSFSGNNAYVRRIYHISENPNRFDSINAYIDDMDVLHARKISAAWLNSIGNEYLRLGGPAKIVLHNVQMDISSKQIQCGYIEVLVQDAGMRAYEPDAGNDVFGVNFSKDAIAKVRNIIEYGYA